MSSARLNLLPFDQLDAAQFEAFMLHFLGAGISLDVIESLPARENSATRTVATARYRLVRATLVGRKGQKQHGIDVLAYTETGAQWVFQCKHYPRTKFGTDLAREVVADANRDFPEASRYFLVLSRESSPPVEVRRIVEANPKWELWEPSELSIWFFKEISRKAQIDTIRRFFPATAAQLIAQLYPQQDVLLVSEEQFFELTDRPGAIFHHHAKLIGRDDALAALVAFAQASGPAAAILSARGGVGKTRLLRAFAERLAQSAPETAVLFLNPNPNPQANDDTLRAAEDGKSVVVFDDAHRAEILRNDIARTIVQKKGKLLLAARPQSVAALQAWLLDTGFSAAQSETVLTLQPLIRSELEQLAGAALDPVHRQYASTLAGLAQGCALVVTVAAELIKQKQLAIGEAIGSDEFRRTVFDRLTGRTLDSLGPDIDRRLARDSLYLLAILAPWTEQVLPLDKVARLLDCSERAFNHTLDRLKLAGLVIYTRNGLRVVPDLLADHLVRKACYESGDRLTSFAGEIQKLIAPEISCETGLLVIRNLAEAEGQQGDTEGLLVEPFWQSFRTQFAKADFFKRQKLIEAWAAFAVWQPNRSLELANDAIARTDAPPPDNPYGDIAAVFEITPSHERVLGAVPRLLEPIAIFHPEHRREALDLLWQLYRRNTRCDEKNPTGPLGAIGHVTSFDKHHCLDAPADVLVWLGDLLRNTDDARLLLHERSPALAVILKPMFECAIEITENHGPSISFGVKPLPATTTRQLRTDALKLVEELVLPAGEIAVLNVLGVLETAIEIPRPKWAQVPSQEWIDSWLADRKAALALLEKALRLQPPPRVTFRVRRILRSRLVHGRIDPLEPDCVRVLATIADTPELRLTRVLLSNRWSEFVHHLPLQERKALLKEDHALAAWNQLADSVASRLVADFPAGRALFSELDRLSADFTTVGEPLDFSELLAALARVAPDLALAVFDTAIDRQTSVIDRSVVRLFPEGFHLPEPNAKERVRRVLEQSNPVRCSAMLSWLQWVGSGTLDPDIIESVTHWATRLDDKILPQIVHFFSWPDSRTAELQTAILNHMPLASLSSQTLAILSRTLDTWHDPKTARSLPAAFVIRAISEFHRLDDIDTEHQPSIAPVLAAQEPRRFFEMLVRRIREAPARRTKSRNFFPFPFGYVLPLTNLPNDPDYPSLARELMATIRSAAPVEVHQWEILFQWAVLLVSPLGLELLTKWLDETTTAAELERLFQCLKFEGSRLIFEHPDFVRRALIQASHIAPSQFNELRLELAFTASPSIRGFTNHKLDPEYSYYREEAAKATSVHAGDPELAAFYREIVRIEDAEAASMRREAAAEADAEWTYN
jgi:biotin operon repressor